MKLIAHRGNIQGHKPWFENKPEYVDIAIQYGYDAETDVWWRDGDFWLGHDAPRYRVGPHFLQMKGLWCHAKNAEAFEAMLKDDRIHCFWHDEDQHTITSRGITWTHPNADTYLQNGVVVILKKPEIMPDTFGICSDEVKLIREELTGEKQKSFSMKDARKLEDIISFDI